MGGLLVSRHDPWQICGCGLLTVCLLRSVQVPQSSRAAGGDEEGWEGGCEAGSCEWEVDAEGSEEG